MRRPAPSPTPASATAASSQSRSSGTAAQPNRRGMRIFGANVRADVVIAACLILGVVVLSSTNEAATAQSAGRNDIAGSKSNFSLRRARVTEPPPGTQMGADQIRAIREVLSKSGGDGDVGPNLLVWGLGNDSPFWNDATSGRVVFLEDDVPMEKDGTLWYDTIMAKYPYLEAYKIHYTTETVKSFDTYISSPERWGVELDVSDQLPADVRGVEWDVILVDAPLGCCNTGPGRYQSLYTSWVLSQKRKGGGKVTHIFVDDYERKVEREFSREVFLGGHAGGKGELVEVVTRDAPANEQAHYVVHASPAVLGDSRNEASEG